MREEPIDEDEALEAFHRMLDDIFGSPSTVDADDWRADAESWFVESFRRFQEDVEELMEHVPGFVLSEHDDMELEESAVMDAWIDGRRYEIVVTRVPDDYQPDDEPDDPDTIGFSLPLPRTPTPEVSAEDVVDFDSAFREDWA